MRNRMGKRPGPTEPFTFPSLCPFSCWFRKKRSGHSLMSAASQPVATLRGVGKSITALASAKSTTTRRAKTSTIATPIAGDMDGNLTTWTLPAASLHQRAHSAVNSSGTQLPRFGLRNDTSLGFPRTCAYCASFLSVQNQQPPYLDGGGFAQRRYSHCLYGL